ncbi:MAG: hypothetical protein IKM80_00940 [Bacilli bacterium]|nr:hypothetical protein [Bacilli bacterium]
MKYANTSRTLSFLAHALIVLAFGALGLYFGAFVVPEYFGTDPTYFTKNLFSGAYLLYLELAVVGLSFAIISGYGLFYAIKGLMNPRDDEPVVKALTTLIVEGWAAGLFFLLQAILFFDLTGNNGNLVFVIVMSLFIAIVLLIATNIPMVKLYDGKDQKPLLRGFIGGAMVLSCAIALEAGLSLIVNATNSSLNAWKQGEINLLLLTITLSSLAAFVLLLLAWLSKFKNGTKVPGFMAGGAAIALAAGLIIYGVLTIVWRDNGIHLNYALESGKTYVFGASGWGYGFPIMNLVVGAVTAAFGGYIMIAASKSSTEIAKA